MLKMENSYYLIINLGLAKIKNIYLPIYLLRLNHTDAYAGSCSSTRQNHCRRWYKI